jgi:hypothetical protein
MFIKYYEYLKFEQIPISFPNLLILKNSLFWNEFEEFLFNIFNDKIII